MKILLVEDNFVTRKLLNSQLSAFGEIDIAANGKEAIEAVKIAFDEHQHYDLICLDIMMPETDGVAALKQIRYLEEKNGLNQKTQAKVIMTTAMSDKQYVVASARACCDAYLIKPITKDRLFSEIKKLGISIPE